MEIVLNGIHPAHHVAQVIVVELVAFEEKVVVEKIRVPQRVCEEQRIEIPVKPRLVMHSEIVVETPHHTVHTSSVACHIGVEPGVHRVEGYEVSFVVKSPVHLDVHPGLGDRVGVGESAVAVIGVVRLSVRGFIARQQNGACRENENEITEVFAAGAVNGFPPCRKTIV